MSRAKEYYNPSDETACGTISYLLWGGESMRVWAKNKLNELEKEERQVSEQVEKGIRNKVKEHNDAVKDLKVDWNPKTTYAELLEVFERGIGAYKSNPSSVRPNVKSPEQWAYARVNSFLYALKNGKFRSGKHDTDLLPVNHPVKKQMKEENNIDMKKIDKRHIEKIEETETHYIIHYLKDEHEMMEEEEVEDIEEVEEVEEVKKDEDDDIYRNLTKQEGFERRFFNKTEMRIDEENPRRVVGYASVFNSLSEDLGGFREQVSERAFESVMSDNVVALINHDMNYPLARTDNGSLQLTVDSKGLRYSFDVPEGLSYGNDLLINLKSGNIYESSFGFIVE